MKKLFCKLGIHAWFPNGYGNMVCKWCKKQKSVNLHNNMKKKIIGWLLLSPTILLVLYVLLLRPFLEYGWIGALLPIGLGLFIGLMLYGLFYWM